MSFGAGAAANVIGGEMQGWAALLDKRAMGSAFKGEQERQNQFADSAGGVLNQEIPLMGSDQAKRDLAQGAADRQALYATLQKVPMAVQSVGKDAPQGGQQMRADQAYANMRGQARARLGAYSDWALDQTLRGIQSQEALRRVVDRAHGDASVFPYQMYQAQHKYDDLAMAGAAIASIGGGAANYSQYATAPQGQQQPQFSNVPGLDTGYNPYTQQSIYQPYGPNQTYALPPQ